MEKILIVADMEGCTGLFDMSNIEAAQRCMHDEVSAIIRMLQSAGNYEIGVVDCHNTGRNLTHISKFFPDVPVYAQFDGVENLKRFDSAILTGYHGMKGKRGYFAHTLRPEIQSVYIQERPVGEVELMVRSLRQNDINVRCVCGDKAACEEANEIGVPSIIVKDIDRPDDDLIIEMLMQRLQVLLTEKCEAAICDDENIEIIFEHEIYCHYIPVDMFQKTERGVLFSGIREYNREIARLCKFLNAGNVAQKQGIQLLRRFVRDNFTEEDIMRIHDEKLFFLLREKASPYLTRSDIQYIYSCLESAIDLRSAKKHGEN